MCIFCLALNVNTLFPLVLIQNRDEETTRKSSGPFDDDQHDDLICGIDERSQGTWFGLNHKTGSLGVLNNIRHKDIKATKSRGQFVKDVLNNQDKKQEQEQQYNACHLLIANLYHKDIPIQLITNNTPSIIDNNDVGVYCMSNQIEQNSDWPKIKFMKQRMCQIVASSLNIEQLIEELSSLLTNTDDLFGYYKINSDDFDTEYSPLSREKELANQHVFIAHDEGKPILPLESSGTISQSMIIKTHEGDVYYCYRSTLNYPHVGKFEVRKYRCE